MAQQSTQEKTGGSRVERFINPEFCGIEEETFDPTIDDFRLLWCDFEPKEKQIIQACINNKIVKDAADEAGVGIHSVTRHLRENAELGRAVLIAKLCRMASATERRLYIEAYFEQQGKLAYYTDEMATLVKTDKAHLAELAVELTVDGDGKRGILKQIVAYGMQVKTVENAIHDPNTGAEVAPKIVALADPRMAFNAVQELNRMDHEYGQDDKATSSVESQADRIRRLAATMNTAAEKQAVRVGAVVKRVTSNDLTVVSSDEA